VIVAGNVVVGGVFAFKHAAGMRNADLVPARGACFARPRAAFRFLGIVRACCRSFVYSRRYVWSPRLAFGQPSDRRPQRYPVRANCSGALIPQAMRKARRSRFRSDARCGSNRYRYNRCEVVLSDCFQGETHEFRREIVRNFLLAFAFVRVRVEIVPEFRGSRRPGRACSRSRAELFFAAPVADVSAASKSVTPQVERFMKKCDSHLRPSRFPHPVEVVHTPKPTSETVTAVFGYVRYFM